MIFTLHYTWGEYDEVDFDYEVEVDLSGCLRDYLENEYGDPKTAAEELAKDGEVDEEDRKRMLKCETFDELAGIMDDIDPAWGTDMISSDDSYLDSLEEELKEEHEEDALEAYEEINDGCDPDGFYGWDDYYRWKNGSDCFDK